jgi:hypothetical protein
MGRILLVGRLAVRDLRRRRIEAALLLLAIMAATTTLTLGLVLRDAASDPFQSTRGATNGPDVVASVDQPAELSGLEELASAPASPTTADRTRSPRRNFRQPVERQMCRPWDATPRPRRSTSPS